MKRKRTKFEAFAQRFLVASMVLFVFGIVAIKAVESSYVRDYQKLNEEIQMLHSTIDALALDKQEMVSFTRLTAIAEKKGYTYKSDAVVISQNNGVITE